MRGADDARTDRRRRIGARRRRGGSAPTRHRGEARRYRLHRSTRSRSVVDADCEVPLACIAIGTSHDIVKDVRGSKSNCEQDSRKM
jgi:hypothetical protein